ncbi:MAG: LPS assembly lipoprotein LptE [Phycisphaerales bacterium]
MSVLRSVAVVTFTLAIAWMSAGCASDPRSGYALDAEYDQSVRTVAVPIFENRTFDHGLEYDLTEAIIKEIHAETPWKVTQGAGADTELTGIVSEVRQRKLSTERESGFVQELAVEIIVSFEWKERRTGEILVTRSRFRSSEAFVPGKSVRERREMGRRAAVQELAENIVRELRSAW